MDFTINIYTQLLDKLIASKSDIQTFHDFMVNEQKPAIILRHDVDLKPAHSLRFAQIQQQRNVKGTYFFRAVPESWDEKIIREIAAMGHEIGYHYENLTTCKGNIDAAWDDFRYHLDALRKLAPVDTICMHGSPRSAYDSKDLWKKYHYRDLGIIAEPYFDVDFSEMMYLTDTGRRWDGYKVSVRDKIPLHQDRWNSLGWVFHSTSEVIQHLEKLPHGIMFTFHPQRWNSSFGGWMKELMVQNAKNWVKRTLISIKK